MLGIDLGVELFTYMVGIYVILVETAKQFPNGCTMQFAILVPLQVMYETSRCTVCVSCLP